MRGSLTRFRFVVYAVRDAAWVRLLPLPSVGPSMATGTALWYSGFDRRVFQSLAYIAGEGAHFLSFGEQGPPQLLIRYTLKGACSRAYPLTNSVDLTPAATQPKV